MPCVDGITVWEAESAWNIMQMRRLIYFFLKIWQHLHYRGGFPLSWPETLQPVVKPGWLPSPASPEVVRGAFSWGVPRAQVSPAPLALDSSLLNPSPPLTSCVTFQCLLNLSGPPFSSLQNGNTDLLVLWGVNKLINRKLLELTCSSSQQILVNNIFIIARLFPVTLWKGQHFP